jgi:hypothetical protein
MRLPPSIASATARGMNLSIPGGPARENEGDGAESLAQCHLYHNAADLDWLLQIGKKLIEHLLGLGGTRA